MKRLIDKFIVFYETIKLYKRSDNMYKLTKDSVIVGAWVTAVLVFGYTIEQVPENWDLRKLVQEVLDEMTDEEKENY